MKRAFLTLLAVAAMASCSKDDIITSAPRQAISFGNVFVDNSTRADVDPSHTTASLDKFYVYGNVTDRDGGVNGQTANLYKGAEVTKAGSVWNCTAIQYWVPECRYDFVAVSDVTATDAATGAVQVTTANGLPSKIKYDVTSQKDLLYATKMDVATDTQGTPAVGVDGQGQAKPVEFTFDHLLSKVQFTFTNNFPAGSDVELTVTDIKITNAHKSATYDVASETWGEFSGTTADTDALSFGQTAAIAASGGTGVSSTKCVLIPAEQAFAISFTVKHNKGGQDTPIQITTSAIELEKGHSYNFTAELNAENVSGVVPVRFTISTNDGWANGDMHVGPIYPPQQ